MFVSNFTEHALHKVDVSTKLGKEYPVMFDDIMRMVVIQFTIQLMFYLSSPDRGFFTEEFVLLVLYVILGVSLYWLVFRNIIVFV